MAYTEEMIGFWVWRSGRKAHRIESVINGQLITNCGRWLRTEGWKISNYYGHSHCFQCDL